MGRIGLDSANLTAKGQMKSQNNKITQLRFLSKLYCKDC